MGLVKVWNKNMHPLEERFRDQQIKIPPGGYIVMDEEEAELYRGQFKPILKTADGGHDPKGFKMLFIEPDHKQEPKNLNPHLCQACKFAGASKEELDEHIDGMHLDQLQDKEFADKRKKAKKSA